jgi:hypothetical protein
MSFEANAELGESWYRTAELDDPIFRKVASNAEEILQSAIMDKPSRKAYTKATEQKLSRLFGYSKTNQAADVIGEALVADEEGDITGEEILLSTDELTYEGIEIIVDQTTTLSHVSFRFGEAIQQPDGTFTKKTYFVPHNRIIKFTLEDLDELDITEPERISVEFEHIAERATRIMNKVYEKNVLAVYANSYTRITLSENGDPSFEMIDQNNVALEKRTTIIGVFEVATFIEIEKHSDLDEMTSEQPELLIYNNQEEVYYMVPITDFHSAEVVIPRSNGTGSV